MKRARVCIILFLMSAITSAVPRAPCTMRVDYYHAGDVSHETFSLDEIVLEPLPWPGNPDRAVDGTNQGYYRPEVNCIMFTRTDYFCRVCKSTIERVIDLYSRP